MAIKLRVPAAGESVTEVEIGEWLKHPGETVRQDEIVVVIESDKAALELPSPAAGILARVLKETGETARPGDVIGIVAEEGEDLCEVAAGQEPEAPPAREAPPPAAPDTEPEPLTVSESAVAEQAELGAPPGAPVGEEGTPISAETAPARAAYQAGAVLEDTAAPASGGAGLAAQEAQPPQAIRAGGEPGGLGSAPVGRAAAWPALSRQEEAVPMTHLRRRIAERLVQAQHSAALLTTFNEIDVSAVVALRKELQPLFQERHGVKLGLMPFFVKSAIEALKLVPEVNAEIRDDAIVYHNYYDIGIAVGGGRGLVVPVLRNAERLSFSQIEHAIGDFARRAGENKLKVEELQGGTFTISNGGIYGSLLSTPIVNPPQSGVLGMHAIQDRPVALDGQVVIRPMMYVALTYDHRIIDGREAVNFLRRVKECIEEPTRILLEV